MPSFSFSKLIPSGNPTIILHEPALSPTALAALSPRLMQPLHIGGEQVGALYCTGKTGSASFCSALHSAVPQGQVRRDSGDSNERGRLFDEEGKFFAEGQFRRIAELGTARGAGAEDRGTGCAESVYSYGTRPEQKTVPGEVSRQKEAPPRLQMMGGEFCVNATRAAALLLARQGRLADVSAHGSDTPVWGGNLLVSGMERPALILVSRDEGALALAAASADTVLTGARPCLDPERGPRETLLHCAARIDCAAPETVCRPLRAGITLVRMPGMIHALIDADGQPLPDLEGNGWRRASADRRSECGLSDAPASGIIWFRREGTGFRIWPAVEVKATLSEHLESACGSASLALALWQWQHTEAGPVDVLQPAGETLRVFPAAEPGRAWISGPVLLAAEGVVHV